MSELCPNCHGQKTVSKPPWIAGDQQTWTGSSTETFPCPTCDARGYLTNQDEPDILTCSICSTKYSRGYLCSKCFDGGLDESETK